VKKLYYFASGTGISVSAQQEGFSGGGGDQAIQMEPNKESIQVFSTEKPIQVGENEIPVIHF
jgi:hypothetical protein